MDEDQFFSAHSWNGLAICKRLFYWNTLVTLVLALLRYRFRVLGGLKCHEASSSATNNEKKHVLPPA